MVNVREFLSLNYAKELNSELLEKFQLIPNSVDPTLVDKRNWNWKIFADYVKPSRTIEVMKILPEQGP